MNNIIEILTSGNIIFIITFIILSGIIAYFGDIIGYRLGKKRISIGKIRPRTTAKIITIITGIIIASTTLLVSAFLSENVRTFLFHMDEIREDIATLENEKNSLKKLSDNYKDQNRSLIKENKEIEKISKSLKVKNKNFINENKKLIEENRSQNKLNKEMSIKNINLAKNNTKILTENKKLLKDNNTLSSETNRLFTKVNELKNIIEVKKKNSLAFTANQIVDYVILGKNIGEENITQKFKGLVERVISICKKAGAKPRNFTEIWNESEPARNSLSEFIKNIYLKQSKEKRKELLVKVISPENVFKGEKINSFQFWFEQNVIHIPKGYSSTYFIDGTKSRYKIALSLEMFFNYMKDYLKVRGVVTELSIPTIKIYDLVTQFHTANQKIKLYMTFTDNVYTIGTIKYEFRSENFVEPIKENTKLKIIKKNEHVKKIQKTTSQNSDSSEITIKK